MQVTHIIGIFSPEHGGPVVSLSNYAKGQAAAGIRVRVRTLDGYSGTSPAVQLPSPIEQAVFQVQWPEKLGRSPKLAQFLAGDATPDIYHLHGAWLRAMYYGYREARIRKRPFLIQINGAYQLFDLHRKPWRKRLVRSWFQDRILREANCLHVNSVREAREIRSLGFRQPIVVIPAGFDVAGAAAVGEGAKGPSPWGDVQAGKYFLYLARLHPNKGIELLLQAWEQLAESALSVKLLIVGTGEQKYVKQFCKMLDSRNLRNRCVWKGFVTEREKAWCFQNAQFYCLPSFTENFGNTVQEALGFGRPVLTTTETPWTELPAVGCGWIAEPTLPSLVEKLQLALQTSEEEMSGMGRRGKDYIRREFSLATVVKNQIETYGWLLGERSAPAALFRE